MGVRIGINGFGRIGRGLMRVLKNYPQIEVVAINDIADKETLVHLLKYDSVHRAFPGDVVSTENGFSVDGHNIVVFNHSVASSIRWDSMNVDVVIESTGNIKSKVKASAHLKPGVKRVIISAPAEDDIPMIVLGVNESILDDYPIIISNASCTTNCLAPMMKVLDENFGVVKGYMTTIHAYTGDQKIQDAPHKDLRRARAAAYSIIPTTTGAAKAVGKVLPNMLGKLDGFAMRVPTITGSATDVTVELSREVTAEEINAAMKAAAPNMKGAMRYTEDPIVSADIIGDEHGCIFDALLTSTNGNLVKVMGWYDNESGYSARMVDLLDLITKD